MSMDEDQVELQDDSKDNPKRHVYILPQLFTLAALFGGFYAIVMAMNGHYVKAALGIFAAMILDSMDGRVARYTRTESEFGAQFDSLSDMVSFAVAPALVVYVWGLKEAGKLGWVVAFIYCACGALRLARFNTNIGVVDKRFFQGLPSPAAAAIVASFVWTFVDYETPLTFTIAVFALIVTLFAGLSMVSNIPFYSFKDINTRKRLPYIKAAYFGLAFIFILAFFTHRAPQTLFAVFMGYALSGYLICLRNKLKGEKNVIVMPKAEEVAGNEDDDAQKFKDPTL